MEIELQNLPSPRTIAEKRKTKVEARHPQGDKISVWLTNARVLCEHGEFDLALNLICQTLNIDSYHIEALKLLTQVHVEKKNWSHAERAADTLLKQENSFENLVINGDIYYATEQDEKARKFYEDALCTLTFEGEKLFSVYKNLGNLCVKSGDFDQAEEYYNKAFTLNANSDVILVNFGTLAIQRGDFNAAAERFRSALELNQKNDKAWVGLSMVHNLMGDHSLAIGNIERALDTAPENRTAVHLAAQWMMREHQYSKASEVLQNYISINQEDSEMSLVLIHSLCLQNKTDLAKLEVERLLLWHPFHEQGLRVEAELRANSPAELRANSPAELRSRS